MDIRTLPMSFKDGSFKGKSIEQIQNDFFIDYLQKNKNNYHFKSKNTFKKGDLILFHIGGRVIASAIFKSMEIYSEPFIDENNESYKGAYIFEPETINVFDPIDSNEFKKYSVDFKRFNQSSQVVEIINFSSFKNRIEKCSNINKLNDEKTFVSNIDCNKTRVKTENDWIKVLDNEESLGEGKIFIILKYIYLSENHLINCGKIADYMNESVVVINNYVTSFGGRALKLLGLPEIPGEHSQHRRWNIPFMTEEKLNKNGLFMWKIRPELLLALEKKYNWKEIYDAKFLPGINSDETSNLTLDAVEKSNHVRIKEVQKKSPEEIKQMAKYCGREITPNKEVKTIYRERNPYVTQHTKDRAKGICDLCGQVAPFKDKDENPYLESHHVITLADNGPDAIYNTVAICPNCHRRIHILKLKSDNDKLEDVIYKYLVLDKDIDDINEWKKLFKK